MHEEEIATFEALTGLDKNTASQYLRSCSWNVEEAFNIYSATGDGTNSASPAPQNANFGGLDQYESDAAMAAAFADSFSPSEQKNSGGSAQLPDPSQGGYDDGVRAPTEYTTGRLVDDNPFNQLFEASPLLAGALGQGFHSHNMMGQPSQQFGHPLNPPRVKDIPDADWMFPLPSAAKKLNCGGEIAAARQRAKEEQKWLLVNLQSVDIFDSHRMNRDVWSNDSILSVLESSFVFWQRSSSCEQGSNFLRLYKITDEMLPITIIIGPTGSLLFSQSGFVSVPDLSSSLFEFLDTHDMDSTERPLTRERNASNDTANSKAIPTPPPPTAVTEEDEDDALTAAIKMSLEQGHVTSQVPPPRVTDPVDSLTTKLGQSTLLGTNDKEDFSDSYIAPSAQDVLGTTGAAEETLGDAVSSKGAVLSHLPADLEELTAEPAKGTAGSTRMQIRLADGKTVVRRFLLEDKIAVIYSVVIEKVPDAAHKSFVLQTPIATSFKLLDVAQETIASQNLANSKIIMSWDDE